MQATQETIIKIEHVSKEYRLGVIGGTTLREELQRKAAKLRHKEDPTVKIGVDQSRAGKRFLALNDISLEVKKGEALGIIGQNGAGKSTLLKLLCRVTAPTKGTIMYNGRIASMLEVGTGFHPELTGRENIYLNGAILGMTREEINQKMEDIIEFSECRQFIDTPVKRYSSGMYVKLAFSVAAHLDSEIMIMDEVLAVGDMKFQQKCLKKMREATKEEGRTVLYVSHNMNTIRQLCDRCVVLNKGRIEYEGNVEDSIERYLGLQTSLQTTFDYTDEFHTNSRSNDDFIIRKGRVLDLNTVRIIPNGQFELELVCASQNKWCDVRFRFEIQFQDGTIAGTALTDSGVNFQPGETKTIRMTFNAEHLVPGRYRADIIAYVFNEFGAEQFLDGVYPGVYIEIEHEINQKNELNWLHRYWGHVHLHDIEIMNTDIFIEEKHML